MGKKILYPVGTQVVTKAQPNYPYFVVQYIKGDKYPYRISDSKDGEPTKVAGKSKFSIKGLKRYNPTQTKDSAKDVASASPKKCEGEGSYFDRKEAAQEVYTKNEVDELINQVYADIETLLQSVDSVAMEALANTKIIARSVDGNFYQVAKTLKTLNHDDD